MLLQTSEKAFNDENYVFEPKSNGVRLLLDNTNKDTRLYTRHGNDITKQVPELHGLNLESCYLDGELVCYKDGKEDFEAVMSRINSKTDSSVQKGLINNPLIYIVFDILYYDKDITSYSLVERKDILSQFIEDSHVIKKTISIETEGEMLFKNIENMELEGIVAKKKISSYQVGRRSYDWLKIINWRRYDCYIYGYKKSATGWLISFMDGTNAGLVEFGMSQTQKEAFYKLATQYITGENKQYVFIESIFKCRVKGRGINTSGVIMTPVFIDFVY